MFAGCWRFQKSKALIELLWFSCLRKIFSMSPKISLCRRHHPNYVYLVYWIRYLDAWSSSSLWKTVNQVHRLLLNLYLLVLVSVFSLGQELVLKKTILEIESARSLILVVLKFGGCCNLILSRTSIFR